MSLNVTVPDTFNGPLDLLLHLIRRDEMDIYDIPVSRLTSAYLEEMNRLPVIDVDEGTEFLDLASRLLEIKGRMLLPPDELPAEAEEEDGDDFDPRSGLVEALLEYRRFKDAAGLLGEMAEEQARRFPRVAPRMDFSFAAQEGAPDAGANDLMRALRNLLDRLLPELSGAPDVIAYTEVSIATRTEQITANLAAVERTRFSRLLSDRPTRSEMAGLFIAVLELVRLGKIIARQTDDFSDIIIERRVASSAPGATFPHLDFFAPPTIFSVFTCFFSRRSVKKSAPAPAIFPPVPPFFHVPQSKRRGAARRNAPPPGLFPGIFTASRRNAKTKRNAKKKK